jgi:hypothetical protein
MIDIFNMTGPDWTFTPLTKPKPTPLPSGTAHCAARLLYDRKEAARQLSISVRSLDYLIAAGKLETRRNGKKVLVTHRSLVRFASGNHYESPASLPEAEAA